MDFSEKLNKLAEILDLDESKIYPDLNLSDLPEWDSLAILTYSIFMQEQFNKFMQIEEIKKFVKVKDILDSMHE